MILRFTIAEEPQGKARARSGNGRVYTPPKTRRYETTIRATCLEAMRRQQVPRFSRPVLVLVVARLRPAVSLSKRRRESLLSGEVAITGRSDADNITKAVLDGMNRVAFDDDRLVVQLHTYKVASETVGVDVMVRAYEPADAYQGLQGW